MLDKTDTEALQREAFRRDVLDGLSRPTKTLPARWLYDDRGSELFEEITKAPEYYPTRTELALLRRHAGDIATAAGPGASMIEFGSGASLKAAGRLSSVCSCWSSVDVSVLLSVELSVSPPVSVSVSASVSVPVSEFVSVSMASRISAACSYSSRSTSDCS